MRIGPRPAWHLIIIGFSGVGKTTVGRYLGREFDVLALEVGDVVRAEASAHGMRPQEYADAVFRCGAYLHFVRQTLSRVEAAPVIIVGPRRPEEIKYLRAKLRKCTVVALQLSFETRCARQGPSCDAFLLRERDRVESSWGLDDAVASADCIVDAAGALESVVKEVYAAWRKPPNSNVVNTE